MRVRRATKQSATEYNRAITEAGIPGSNPIIDALTSNDVTMLEDICGYALARPPSAGLVPMPAMHLGRLRTLQRTGGLPQDLGNAMLRLNELVEIEDGARPLTDDLMSNMLSWMHGRGHDVGPVGRALLARHVHVNRYA